jgi:hypothetical protein
MDAGINAATHLGEHRCRDHDNCGDSANYREVAEHQVTALGHPISAAAQAAARDVQKQSIKYSDG